MVHKSLAGLGTFYLVWERRKGYMVIQGILPRFSHSLLHKFLSHSFTKLLVVLKLPRTTLKNDNCLVGQNIFWIKRYIITVCILKKFEMNFIIVWRVASLSYLWITNVTFCLWTLEIYNRRIRLCSDFVCLYRSYQYKVNNRINRINNCLH